MAELAQNHDFELLERARVRDPAIRLIIQQHNQRLYRIARSIVRNDDDAEDVLQEAYFRAFANLASFRGETRPAPGSRASSSMKRSAACADGVRW